MGGDTGVGGWGGGQCERRKLWFEISPLEKKVNWLVPAVGDW